MDGLNESENCGNFVLLLEGKEREESGGIFQRGDIPPCVCGWL